MEFKPGKRYTEYIKQLEGNLEKLDLEMKEHVYTNYQTLIETFKELRNMQLVNLNYYDECFESLKGSVQEILKPVVLKTPNISSKVEKWSKEWWQELPDELDSLLAEEKYEELISVIEEAKVAPTTEESINCKLEFDVHVLKVIEQIAKELQKPQTIAPGIYIYYLRRLDSAPAAEDAYFLGKSQQLKVFIRRVGLEEDPIEGIEKQAQVFFSIIRKTAQESQELRLSSSRLYMWMLEEMKTIANELGEELYLIGDVKLLTDTLKVIIKNCEALEKSGIFLELELHRGLVPFLQKRIQELYLKDEEKLEKELASEIWKPQIIKVEHESGVSIFRLTGSANTLHCQVQAVIEQACLFLEFTPIWSASIVPTFIKIIQLFTEKYIRSEKHEYQKDQTTLQSVTCNLWNIANFTGIINSKIRKKLNLPALDLHELDLLKPSAESRASDLVTGFAYKNWELLLPKYIESLEPLNLLSKEFEKPYNLEHLVSVQEGMESVESGTDRNYFYSKKFGEDLLHAYLEVLSQTELTQLKPGAVQQLVFDLYMVHFFAQKHNLELSVTPVIEEVLNSQSLQRDLLVFDLEFYENAYNNVSFI